LIQQWEVSWDDTLDPAVSYKIGQVILAVCCYEPPFIYHLPFLVVGLSEQYITFFIRVC
jgi:hypothetical protein